MWPFAAISERNANRDKMEDETEEDSEVGRADANRQMLFPDAKAMKEHMRAQMTKPEYDVGNYYHNTGFCQWIARHSMFEKSTLVVIAANAVWIAVDTDYNKAEVLLTARPIFQLAEHAFCMYFTFEWTMRFCAFRNKCDCRKDAWFVFDSMLVGTMVIETWMMTLFLLMMGAGSGGGLGNASILRIARLLRLTRMARMARLLRAMPELLILIKGMMAAMRSVFFTLALLILIIYVFAIALTQLCADAECGDGFGKVLDSMHRLLVDGALMDNLTGIIQPLHAAGIHLLLVFYVFLLLAALTIMNMLIGVICEVVSAVAATEREQMTLAGVKEKILELMSVSDADGNSVISKSEFMELLANKKAAVILDGVGVDVFSLVDFADYIFSDDSKDLTFADVMNLVLDLRGTNSATVRDILDLRRFMKTRFTEIEQAIKEIPRCMATDVRPCLSTDEMPSPPKNDVSEALTNVQLKRDKLKTHIPPQKNSSQALADVELKKDKPESLLSLPSASHAEPLNFKELLDSSLNLLLSAHEHEVAVMQEENGLLHEVLHSHEVTTTGPPSSPPHLPDQADAVCARLRERSPGTLSEYTIGSATRTGDIEDDYGWSRRENPGGPDTSRPPATGPAWDPPAAPLEPDCASVVGPWFRSARVVPVTTVVHGQVEALH